MARIHSRPNDPVRCEIFFRNLQDAGFVFHVDRAAGTVRTTVRGEPVDPVIEEQVQLRAWWLLGVTDGQTA